MQLQITFKQIDSSEALRAFITHKSETLKKFFNGKVSIDWILSQERQNKIAHCHLLGDHINDFSEGISGDFYTSVEIALKKLSKQLSKHKEVLKSAHHHQETHP